MWSSQSQPFYNYLELLSITSCTLERFDTSTHQHVVQAGETRTSESDTIQLMRFQHPVYIHFKSVLQTGLNDAALDLENAWVSWRYRIGLLLVTTPHVSQLQNTKLQLKTFFGCV